MIEFHDCTCCTAPGNGGKTDRYVWTQQLADLSINVPVPEGTKTKMLDVKITNTKLKVIFKKKIRLSMKEHHFVVACFVSTSVLTRMYFLFLYVL